MLQNDGMIIEIGGHTDAVGVQAIQHVPVA